MKKEVKIAFVAIIALGCLFYGMSFLKGEHLFSSDENYYISFEDITGVRVTCGIYADGVRVGSVSAIDYDYDHGKPTLLTATIDPDMRIPKGSTAEIVNDLMGNCHINLLLANNPRERIKPGQTIVGVSKDALMSKVSDMVPQVEAVVSKLDSVMTSLNVIFSDPAIAKIFDNLDNFTGSLNVTTSEANKLLKELNRTVPNVISEADATVANTKEFTRRLNELDLQQTLQSVNNTIGNVDKTLDEVRTTVGTLGSSLNTTISDADSLVTDIKAHPKRYVHFSVFGRKDK